MPKNTWRLKDFWCLIIGITCLANNGNPLKLAYTKKVGFVGQEMKAVFLDLLRSWNQPWEVTGSHGCFPFSFSLLPFWFGISSSVGSILYERSMLLNLFQLYQFLFFPSKMAESAQYSLNNEWKIWMADILLEPFWSKFFSQYVIYSLFVGGNSCKERMTTIQQNNDINIFLFFWFFKTNCSETRQVDFFP